MHIFPSDISPIRFIFKILRRLRMNGFVYSIVKMLIGKKKKPLTKQAIQSAEQFLESLSPDPDHSAITNNRIIDDQYDLEIIVPAYNVEKYVQMCIDSILSQETHYHFLTTIVDDGSTDSTPKIIDQYSGRADVHIIHQKNLGFSGSRNGVLKEIHAKHLMFVDSDDLLPQGTIERMLDVMYEYQCDVVAGNHSRIINGKETPVNNLTFNSNADYHQVPGYTCIKMFKSSLFSKLQFPLDYWFEDSLVYMMIFPQCKRIVTIPDEVYKYRIHSTGISKKSIGNLKCLDSFWVTRRLMKDRDLLKIQESPSSMMQMLMQQVKINFQRINSINRMDVNRSVFTLTAQLVQNLPKIDTPLNTHAELYEALMNNHFWKYYFYCSLK